MANKVKSALSIYKPSFSKIEGVVFFKIKNALSRGLFLSRPLISVPTSNLIQTLRYVRNGSCIFEFIWRTILSREIIHTQQDVFSSPMDGSSSTDKK